MTHHIFLYLLAALSINLIPGSDMLYIISQSVSYDRQLGLAAVLGIATGCFVHIFAATIGLSALIFKSALAFSIIKYLGACYLLYLGISFILQKNDNLFDEKAIHAGKSWRKIYYRGFITNALNPKVALFFLAFLPQFVVFSPSSYSPATQMLILGLIFNCSSTLVNSLVACFFGKAKEWLSHNAFMMKLQRKISGAILVGLSVK